MERFRRDKGIVGGNSLYHGGTSSDRVGLTGVEYYIDNYVVLKCFGFKSFH